MKEITPATSLGLGVAPALHLGVGCQSIVPKMIPRDRVNYSSTLADTGPSETLPTLSIPTS